MPFKKYLTMILIFCCLFFNFHGVLRFVVSAWWTKSCNVTTLYRLEICYPVTLLLNCALVSHCRWFMIWFLLERLKAPQVTGEVHLNKIYLRLIIFLTLLTDIVYINQISLSLEFLRYSELVICCWETLTGPWSKQCVRPLCISINPLIIASVNITN